MGQVQKIRVHCIKSGHGLAKGRKYSVPLDEVSKLARAGVIVDPNPTKRKTVTRTTRAVETAAVEPTETREAPKRKRAKSAKRSDSSS